jgi:hypothetical protein
VTRSVAIFADRAIFRDVQAQKISISVGKEQLAAAKRIAKREGLSLSAVFMRGLAKELEAEERRAALDELVKNVPPLSNKRKREIRAAWGRKGAAA